MIPQGIYSWLALGTTAPRAGTSTVRYSATQVGSERQVTAIEARNCCEGEEGLKSSSFSSLFLALVFFPPEP